MVKVLIARPHWCGRLWYAAWLLPIVFFVACLLPAHGASPETPMSHPRALGASLSPKIDLVEGQGIVLGVLFEDLSGRPLFAHREQRPLVLASNTKLFTTTAALLSLPEDFRWSTSARLDGDTLWIVGAGDASFHIIDGFSYPDRFLDELATALGRAGVRRIRELVVDGRYFDDETRHALWPQDQLRKTYSAPVVGLPYARGLIRMKQRRRVVYAATFSPLHVIANFAKHGLRKRGIAVDATRVAEGSEATPDAEATIYRQESPFSLAQLIYETNAGSDNFYAEHLLKTLGAEFGDEGSFDEGIRSVRHALSMLEIPLTGFAQMDGSGLARAKGAGNLASPRTVVALLRAMAQHPRGVQFVSSLAVAGVSGTIERRFDEPPLRGRVYAKTGKINGSITLSGFLVHETVPVAAFSILGNFEGEGTFALHRTIYQFQDDALNSAWVHLQATNQRWATPPALVSANDAADPDASGIE